MPEPVSLALAIAVALAMMSSSSERFCVHAAGRASVGERGVVGDRLLSRAF